MQPLRLLRRVIVAVLGVAIVLVGIVLLFIPGPGTVVILAGLAVLGSEFDRPRRWVRSMRERARQAMQG
ncbi:MAG: hypothetical protein HKN80_03815 [Acidimicrobiia bacterium]|nr:hypothetical protein [Acidimicrobiia bacterium]